LLQLYFVQTYTFPSTKRRKPAYYALYQCPNYRQLTKSLLYISVFYLVFKYSTEKKTQSAPPLLSIHGNIFRQI